MSEQTEYEDNGNGTEDSSVIRELRSKVKAFEKQSEANAELASSFAQARLEAAAGIIDRPGNPKLTEVVVNLVDGFPTPEKVRAVLADLGLAEAEAPVEDVIDSAPDAPSVQKVAGLGQRAATAAGAGGAESLDAKLANAVSQAEINEIMLAAGLSA